jgi:hypothetical protein
MGGVLKGFSKLFILFTWSFWDASLNIKSNFFLIYHVIVIVQT